MLKSPLNEQRHLPFIEKPSAANLTKFQMDTKESVIHIQDMHAQIILAHDISLS